MGARRNWEEFARTLETALDMRTSGRFRDLFEAPIPEDSAISVARDATTW